jgi:membrane protein implicated in regulation of membrane protease activity
VTLTYIVLTVLGGGYVLLSLFLGHGHEGDAGGDGGGHDHGGSHEAHMSYGVKGEGHGASEAHSGHGAHAFHFPFFSPLALATLFASIGAWGLITQEGFGASDTISLAVAVPAAVVTAYLITYAGWRLVSGSSGSSQIRAASLEGAIAEVTTPIPAGGMGEVAALVDGQRFSGPAREIDGKAVPRGAHVRVRSLVGATLVVQQKEG